ncbi:hypothetical protein BJD11_21765 [Xanthomonas euvesicatoria]|nr:hypothetical protein BJD11_21765 [Xanthomonas euvesicatoria]
MILGECSSAAGDQAQLPNLAIEAGRELSVCILEKGSEPGEHILSGAPRNRRAVPQPVEDRGRPPPLPPRHRF